MKLVEHVEGFRRALGVRRALDRTLPRHPPPGPLNLWRFRQNALALMRGAAPAGDVVRVDLLYRPTLLVQHPDDVATIFEQPDLWLRGEGLVPLRSSWASTSSRSTSGAPATAASCACTTASTRG